MNNNRKEESYKGLLLLRDEMISHLGGATPKQFDGWVEDGYIGELFRGDELLYKADDIDIQGIAKTKLYDVRFVSADSTVDGWDPMKLDRNDLQVLALDSLVGLPLLVPAGRGFAPIAVRINILVMRGYFDVQSRVESIRSTGKVDIGVNYVEASIDRILAPMMIHELIKMRGLLSLLDSAGMCRIHTGMSAGLLFGGNSTSWGERLRDTEWGTKIPRPVLQFLEKSTSLEDAVDRMSLVSSMVSMTGGD